MSDDGSGKKYRQEKNQFSPIYCGNCLQNRVCGELDDKLCCGCKLQQVVEKQKYFGNYEPLLAELKAREVAHRNHLRQQQVDNPHRGNDWRQWYQKRGGIDMVWFLQTYDGLPRNLECAKKGRVDPQHVFCDCEVQFLRRSFNYYTKLLSTYRQRIKKCRCLTHPKTRTSDEYTSCHNCGKDLEAATRKRFIKNRNDPQFWGLKISPQILCLACLKKKFQSRIPLKRKRMLLNEYLKRGYV